jgi:hypothetical protein
VAKNHSSTVPPRRNRALLHIDFCVLILFFKKIIVSLSFKFALQWIIDGILHQTKNSGSIQALNG